MAEFGIFLSSEEHTATDLVRFARQAESSGFRSVLVSDHYHPWLDSQGHSPFVWSVLGGIASTTDLTITTGVTCPTVRIHPAVIAQAAATMAEMAPGRFRLGVGSGEALNEHILADRWPATDVRLEMLEEAIEIMRRLWTGDVVNHHGRYYGVEAARVYEKPADAIPVIVSGFGPKAVELASRVGDGYINVQPDGASVEHYRSKGGTGPTLGALKVCWGPDRDQSAALAHRLWRTESLPGELAQTLPTPAHFEQASQLVTEAMTADAVPCGPDPGPYIKKLRAYVDAGFDEIYINQIGADEAGFVDFFDREVRPAVHLQDA